MPPDLAQDRERRARHPTLVYYIDGHGFGHATRSLAILREIGRRRPDARILVRTSAPSHLFLEEPRAPVELLPGITDPGTVQADPLTLDVEDSLRAREQFQATLAERVREETARLSGEKVALVAGDIPPLAFEVAAALNVPSVALGNFSWDWIYEPLVGEAGAALVSGMRRSYSHATLLLRMPFHGEMSAFRRVEDIPHVVRMPRRGRDDVRAELGLQSEGRPVILVSFGGFQAVQFSSAASPELGDYRFIVAGGGPGGLPGDTVFLRPDHGHSHEDLVGACDAVISKPGYGTVAECLATRTPLLYTEREHFREFPVLVEGIRRFLHGEFLPRRDLLELRWGSHLDALLGRGFSWPPVRVDGAEVAAARLLDLWEA